MAFIDSLANLAPEQWNRLSGTDNPFLRHEFLYGLEKTGCTTADTGWQPRHWVDQDADGHLRAALPCYLKFHSFGEYVFDWAWADAWAHYGLPYYPKLLSAVPFTPSPGPRLLVREGNTQALGSRAADHLKTAMETGEASSWHLLFPDQASLEAMNPQQWLRRLSCQFQWHNAGYERFEDFLGTLKSRKRKQIRHERNRVREQDIHFEHLPGAEITEQALNTFFVYYQATYLKRGQQPYLNKAFFHHLVKTLPEHVHLVMAIHENQYCAAALFLHDRKTLFGRYWGCLEEYDQLHFETCYYQGIDFCIESGLEIFDAGAQGEHKLKRGFRPHLLQSLHWVQDEGLRPAVADFCRREARAIRAYANQAEQALPFHLSRATSGLNES